MMSIKKKTWIPILVLISSSFLMPMASMAQGAGQEDFRNHETKEDSVETVEQTMDIEDWEENVEEHEDESIVTKVFVESMREIEDGQLYADNGALPVGSRFTEGNFSYTVGEDGSLILTGYLGTSSDVVIPSVVTHLGVDYNVTIIGDHAMSHYTHPSMVYITSVVIPEGIVEIEYAGLENNNLSTITLPSTLTTIRSKAFNNDSQNPGIREIIGGENVTLIESSAFASNQITDISMFSNASVADYAFGNQTINMTGNFGDSITFKGLTSDNPIKSNDNTMVVETVNDNVTEDTIYYMGEFSYAIGDSGAYSAEVLVDMEVEDIYLETQPLTWYKGHQGNINEILVGATIGDKSFGSDIMSKFVQIDMSDVDVNTTGEYTVWLNYAIGDSRGITHNTVTIIDSLAKFEGKNIEVVQGSELPSISSFEIISLGEDGMPVDYTVNLDNVNTSIVGIYDVIVTSSDNQTLILQVTVIPKELQYKIVYDGNGGVGNMASQEVYGPNEVTLKINTFSREGYTFKGWSTNKDGTVQYKDGDVVQNLTTTDGSTVILYAIWEKDSSEQIDSENSNSDGNNTNNGQGGNNVKSGSEKKLPSMGGKATPMLTVIGAMTLLASGAYVLTLKRKRNN